MSKLAQILSKIGSIVTGAVAVEEKIIPIFVHDPVSGSIAAVIVTIESEVGNVLTALGAASAPSASAAVPVSG